MAKKPRSKSNRTSFASIVVSISLVLFLLGFVLLFVAYTKRASDHIKENIAVVLYVKSDSREADIVRLKKILDAEPFVKRTEYIDKNRAKEIFKEDVGEDFEDFLGYNPLDASIDVYLKAQFTHPDSLVWIEKELGQNTLVKEVSYSKDVVAMVYENVKMISFWLLIFSGALLLISIVLINNSIRLSIFSKRFIIRTMQLVGATPSFISKPFLIRGFIQGVLGGVIAITFLSSLIYYFKQQYSDIFFQGDIDLLVFLFLGIVALGVFITTSTTLMAVRKYIRINPDKLF